MTFHAFEGAKHQTSFLSFATFFFHPDFQHSVIKTLRMCLWQFALHGIMQSTKRPCHLVLRHGDDFGDYVWTGILSFWFFLLFVVTSFGESMKHSGPYCKCRFSAWCAAFSCHHAWCLCMTLPQPVSNHMHVPRNRRIRVQKELFVDLPWSAGNLPSWRRMLQLSHQAGRPLADRGPGW